MYSQSHAHTCTHTGTLTNTRKQSHAHVHMHTVKHAHTDIAHPQPSAHTYSHALTHTRMHTATAEEGAFLFLVVRSFPISPRFDGTFYQNVNFINLTLQKPGADPPEEDEGPKRVDPLHQLILLFSRTALTEKWYGREEGPCEVRGEERGTVSGVCVPSSCLFHRVWLGNSLVQKQDQSHCTCGPALIQFQASIPTLVVLNSL